MRHDERVVDDALLIERLLRVVDEGRRTATYKLALLLALIDAVAGGGGSSEIGTRSIAAEVLAHYYPQTRIYVAANGIERELRQITLKGSPPLRAALRLRLDDRIRAAIRRRVPAGGRDPRRARLRCGLVGACRSLVAPAARSAGRRGMADASSRPLSRQPRPTVAG